MIIMRSVGETYLKERAFVLWFIYSSNHDKKDQPPSTSINKLLIHVTLPKPSVTISINTNQEGVEGGRVHETRWNAWHGNWCLKNMLYNVCVSSNISGDVWQLYHLKCKCNTHSLWSVEVYSIISIARRPLMSRIVNILLSINHPLLRDDGILTQWSSRQRSKWAGMAAKGIGMVLQSMVLGWRPRGRTTAVVSRRTAMARARAILYGESKGVRFWEKIENRSAKFHPHHTPNLLSIETACNCSTCNRMAE